MKSKLLITALLALNIGLPAVHASEEGGAGAEKPAVGAANLITLSATVTAVNQETREVTLKDADGNELGSEGCMNFCGAQRCESGSNT